MTGPGIGVGSAASASVKRLEQQWGASIFVRNTRSLRLSSDGERILAKVREAIECIEEARTAVTARTGFRGELHVTMPSDLGRNVLLPHLEEFQRNNPECRLRLHLSDSNTDLVRLPVHVAIRYGEPVDSQQVVFPLVADNVRILVASEAYLQRCGVPKSADDLQRHEALRFMLGGVVPKVWKLRIDDDWRSVHVDGRRSSNDGEIVKRWALASLGIAYKSALDVQAEVAAGRLLHVRPDWVGEAVPLFFVVPGRKLVSPAIRALRDWLQAGLAAEVKVTRARIRALQSALIA